ncbi:hypothetical protein FG379_002011 [Cryptosporidium bovis]|uniref:uncharacterized protein n=1 Tax=Cryptosporidium bovis TaxID=310047 RepID=UPI00351A6634|nr:hypothetical protein FG379_002011 [Cryptosporidium bovis]
MVEVRNNIEDEKSSPKRVIKPKNKRKIKNCGDNIRRKAVNIEIPNDVDTNSWDKFCTSVIPLWCRDNRGIIIGKKDIEAKEWEIKTSLHPKTENYVFEAIEELLGNTENTDSISLSLWGRKFVLNSKQILRGKNVLFLTDRQLKNELIIIPYKNICAIFFCNSDNICDFDCKTMMSFINLVHKITNK